MISMPPSSAAAKTLPARKACRLVCVEKGMRKTSSRPESNELPGIVMVTPSVSKAGVHSDLFTKDCSIVSEKLPCWTSALYFLAQTDKTQSKPIAGPYPSRPIIVKLVSQDTERF